MERAHRAPAPSRWARSSPPPSRKHPEPRARPEKLPNVDPLRILLPPATSIRDGRDMTTVPRDASLLRLLVTTLGLTTLVLASTPTPRDTIILPPTPAADTAAPGPTTQDRARPGGPPQPR